MRRAPASVAEYVRIVEERNDVIKRAFEGGAFDDFRNTKLGIEPTTFAVAAIQERISALTGEPCSKADAEVWLWWLRLRKANQR